MASRAGSPVGGKAPGEQPELPKQFVGLSKLDTKEKSFRYLDFAGSGTNAALNRWGQFLQLSRLVVGGGDPDSWNYISVEPWDIFQLEHIAPEKEEEEDEDEGGEESSESKRGTLDWGPDNPEWRPNVCCYSDPAYPRRHDKFNALCVRGRGLGLRFSDNTNISEPEHYYRNDRWPEVRYTVEGEVKVVLQHYIRDGKIIQDMCLTSESAEEIELNLEFEFTTGIRIAPGHMNQPREGEEDAPKHSLRLVPEEEAPGSHWEIWRGGYYVTASLFEDGKPKPFNLLEDGRRKSMTEWDIDILSDYPIRYCETFTLKSGARVKFTSVFKLDHGNTPNNTLPHYFDISPHLESFDDRWWGFKTESSSFIFRRNLETILSHAMPLPWIEGENYQPYVMHDHDLINTFQTWSSSLNQALYLLEVDKVLQHQDTADQITTSHYRERIRKVIFGYFVWLLRHAERGGFPESVLLHWSGKLAPLTEKDETGELGGEAEKGKEVPNGSTEKSLMAEVIEPAGRFGTPLTEADSTDTKTDSLFSVRALGCTSDPEEVGAPHLGKTEGPVDPPAKPFEPELSKYGDKFRNCCQFLVLLDMCLTNYPGETDLFIRMVEAFLKLAWEPIEMSKHRGSHLWPDQLDILEGFPSPYARFQDWGDHESCGYGGQGIYVYVITTQVLVWRAAKSTNRLLGLVSNDRNWSKWMVRQSLKDEAIRDRTIEAFHPPTTDTGYDCFLDRFLSKIKGHIEESFLDQWSCDIVVPSFVENFFFDDKNEPMLAWVETLRYYDTFNDPTKAQKPNTWESFMYYQLAIDRDRRQALRESFEASAYSVGLFTNDAVAPGSHCPYTTSWAMATYFLSTEHTELLYPQFRIPMTIDNPTRADRIQGSMLPPEGLMSAGFNPSAGVGATVREDGRKPRQRGRGFDITAEDRSQVNDPPSYGEWYWFREPLFMKHKPKKFEMNMKSIKRFLEPEYIWSCFWETYQGKYDFMKNMADMPNYNWGDHKSVLIQPSRNGMSGFFQGRAALSKLETQRDREVDKKRILIMEDCMIEHLIALMANIDFQEACHIGEFLSRLRLMDPHEMRFTERTIMPDNLWITEFNINFITTPSLADVESPLPPNYFPKKRARFQSINDVVPDHIMAEAAVGFRIIGDLHDRYWTCYVFYDFGSRELTSDARDEVGRSDYGHSSSQRKCLEGFLVRQALDLVLSETKTVLHIISGSMGGGKEKPQTLFDPLLTEDDLRGENYFKTMNKNSVFYPWLLEVYGTLRDKCIESRSVAEQWISAEKTRKHKPRWTEKDQKSFGEEVARNRMEVKTRCTKLEKMAKNLQERIDRIKTLKESLSSELGLREARTSTQLAQTVNLFAVVTTIYLPLTFSTSIVAIQEFHWSSPAKALVKITLAVTFGTLILLMNLAFLRRNFAALKTWAQRSIRQRMAGAPESPHACEYTAPPSNSPSRPPSKKSVYQEQRPGWKYWKERARGLRQAEKRSTLLTDNATHGNESDWWYWYFMAIFIIIVVPIQELTFIIRTLRLQKIENSGPLKKLVRIPWAPVWILQLALVYAIILIGHALLFLVGLVHRTTVWLWTGNDIAEGKKAVSEEDGKESEPESTQRHRWWVDWWMRPAKTMQFFIVAEALRSERGAEGADLEKQDFTVETKEVPPSP